MVVSWSHCAWFAIRINVLCSLPDVFHYDADYEENEKAYLEIRKELLHYLIGTGHAAAA